MSATKYTYSIANNFPNGKIASNALTQEIHDSEITIALDRVDTSGDVCDIWFKNSLPAPELTILNNIIGSHQGESIVPIDQVEVVNSVKLWATNFHDKVEVHESSRIPGTYTYYTGAGDDSENISDVGGGQQFILHHRSGDPTQQSLYLDFNVAENVTWIHEGYMIWNNANFDTITFEIVPRVVPVTVSSGTYFNLYGGYLIVPAAGDGTIQLASDITQPHGGLVYVPPDYDGVRRAPCFWNATWNSTTKTYENLSAAPLGNGTYNMFAAEVPLSRFVNKIPVLGDGFEMMQSADADEIGQGMRLKATLSTSMPDHYWNVGCILTMHRARTA